MRLRLALVSILVAFAALASRPATACTNILVTKGATVDGSTMISYSADSHTLYGDLPVTPARRFPVGAQRDIIEWDTGKLLGRIPEAPATYSVVGLINEHQLAIGETTFTGREELKGPSGIIDYGSLMFIALERARTAREAVQLIGELVAEHGYASTGESLSIADPNEVWLLEIIGKGEKQKGAVWVAVRMPDGTISAHANKSRIRRFPLHDPANCLYAKDVVSFARDKGWFSGRDEEFSFADAYDPADFESLRFCEARVWSVFRRAAPSLGLASDVARGGHEGAAPAAQRPSRPQAGRGRRDGPDARPLRGHRARHDAGRRRRPVRLPLPLAADDLGGRRQEVPARARHLHAADGLLLRDPVARRAARSDRRRAVVRPRRHLLHRLRAHVLRHPRGPAHVRDRRRLAAALLLGLRLLGLQLGGELRLLPLQRHDRRRPEGPAPAGGPVPGGPGGRSRRKP